MTHPVGGDPGSAGPGADRAASAREVVGLGATFGTGGGTPDKSLDVLTDLAGEGATAAATADTAVVAALKTYVLAGADNSVSHDYTATGCATTSTVFAALAFKTDGSAVIIPTGTITPAANKITIAGGADLTLYNLVFIVKK